MAEEPQQLQQPQQQEQQNHEEKPNSTHNEAQASGEATDDQAYTWPAIRFDVPPYRTYHFYRQFRSSSNPNNFLKSVKWSPDGSCFLTSSDDNTLRLFTLLDKESNYSIESCSPDPDEDSYTANLVINEGESVYDCCWYPYMSASDFTSCVFATGGQDGLVHIYDLQTGQWTSSFAAASDTVNGFSFHPFLPMAVSSSGHRRFGIPDDTDDAEEVFALNSNENCASVWRFSYSSGAENAMSINCEDSDAKLEDEMP